MPGPLSKNYLPQLNIIRAIASLAVAIFHLGGKTQPILNYGWLGVQMFFILTGFVICWSLPTNYHLANFPKFLYKRIVRIEPPYIASIALILIFALVTNSFNQISFKNILLHFAYLNNFYNNDYLSPVYWTLGIEFQFYILIGLIFPFIFKNKYTSIISLTFLNLIAFLIPTKYALLTNYFPYFTIGILIFLYKTKQLKKLEAYMFLLSTIIYLYFNFGVANAIVSLLTGAIILLIDRSNFIIDFFSKISFSLYLTHDIIGSKIVLFLGNLFPVKNLLTKGFSFSIGLAVAILFAYLFYLVIEKRFTQLSKNIKY